MFEAWSRRGGGGARRTCWQSETSHCLSTAERISTGGALHQKAAEENLSEELEGDVFNVSAVLNKRTRGCWNLHPSRWWRLSSTGAANVQTCTSRAWEQTKLRQRLNTRCSIRDDPIGSQSEVRFFGSLSCCRGPAVSASDLQEALTQTHKQSLWVAEVDVGEGSGSAPHRE